MQPEGSTHHFKVPAFMAHLLILLTHETVLLFLLCLAFMSLRVIFYSFEANISRLISLLPSLRLSYCDGRRRQGVFNWILNAKAPLFCPLSKSLGDAHIDIQVDFQSITCFSIDRPAL